MKHTFDQRFWVQSALIAAIYVVICAVAASISFGPIQFRLAEALCVLPVFTPAGVLGLFGGCLISNLVLSSAGILDIVFGSLATLLAAFLTYRLRRRRAWAPIPAIIVNAIIIPAVLAIALNVNFFATMLSILIGQTVVCCGLGYPLMYLLSKHEHAIFGYIHN